MQTQTFVNPVDYGMHLMEKKDRTKPEVKYSVVFGKVEEGYSARLIPVDHPAEYLNGEFVTTSAVLEYDEAAGRIETKNTVYVPLEN